MKTKRWKAVSFQIRLSVLLFFLCCCSSLQAQEVIQHKSGEDLKQYLLDSVKFIAKDYTSGFVKFKDGTSARGPVNISTIEKRIYFINPQGEIQVLANEDKVDYVAFGGKTYIKSRYGYVELVRSNEQAALGIVRRVTFLEGEKTGAFGTKSETTSITSVNTFFEGGNMYTLGVNQNTPYRYKVIPYLYKGDKVLLSTKKNLLKCFPDKKEAIESYLKDHAVDFERLEDMNRLFDAILQMQ